MKIFLIREKGVFSAHAKLSDKEKLFKHTKTPTSHRTQTNVQQSFSNTACHCELAVQQPISEISQSCVSSTAFLSHRFKSSPSIPGKVALSDAAGYMMNAGHFRRNLVSSGDLNRRSQDGVDSLKHGRLAHVRSQFSLFRRSPTHKNLPPATFCASEHVLFGYFLHNAKSDNPFSLQRTSRFCKPRISSPQRRLRIDKIKFFAAPRPFRRPWRHSCCSLPGTLSYFLLGTKSMTKKPSLPGVCRLRRLSFCCCRNRFCRLRRPPFRRKAAFFPVDKPFFLAYDIS